MTESTLRLYYSQQCGNCRQLLKVFQNNPELRRRFTLICIDKYIQKRSKYPKGVRGTPTIHHELRDEIEVYEGDDVFSLIGNMMRQLYSKKNNTGNDDDDDYEVQYKGDRVAEVMEDPGVSHAKYHGNTNRPESWGKGASINTIMEPSQWPEWAVGVDGEVNNDPGVFTQRIKKGGRETSSDELNRRVKEMENQRKAAEEAYKIAVKNRGRRGGGRNVSSRQIVV